MERFILFLKGIVIGIANVIPGLSGGTMAISLNVYEELIESISRLTQNFKKNLAFIIPILLGVLTAIVLFSRVILYFLDNYMIATTCFFVGLILGGLPLIVKQGNIKFNIKNAIVFILTFTFLMAFTFLKAGNAMVSFKDITIIMLILLFLVGVLASATMVVPGISGSFMLVLLGYYEPILNTIKDFTKLNNLTHNFIILSVFGVGILIGIFLISRILDYLFNSYKELTYAGILGIILASILALFIPLLGFKITFAYAFISFLMIDFGILLSYMLGGK